MKRVYIYENPATRMGNYLWQYYSLLSVKEKYDIDEIIFLFDIECNIYDSYKYAFSKEFIIERYEYAKTYIPYFLPSVKVTNEIPCDYFYYIDYSKFNQSVSELDWLFNTDKENIIIGSFLQNVNNIKDTPIEIPHEIKMKLCNKYYDIISNPYFVTVNVRRGDFVDNETFDVCNKRFYEYALGLVGNQEVLFISDDIEWCKSTFIGEKYHFTEDSNLLEDFFVQHLSKTNIIGNSTFSYWAAYTNPNEDKIVICPSMMVDDENYNSDITIPTSWIKINNKKFLH